eukprot:6206606-Pleurochrysis_carterae.AAC.3
MLSKRARNQCSSDGRVDCEVVKIVEIRRRAAFCRSRSTSRPRSSQSAAKRSPRSGNRCKELRQRTRTTRCASTA